MSSLSSDFLSDDPWALPDDLDTAAKSARRSVQIKPIIRSVEPLDRQFGVWPKKSAPDDIAADVFGKPWAYSYALLDAARIEDFSGRLIDRSLGAMCLFDGDAAEEAAEFAPWLVELAEGDNLSRSLFTAGEAKSALWETGSGIVLRSNHTLDELRAQLRKITQFYDDQFGKWVFLRFWDPLFARYLLGYGSDEIRFRLLKAGPMLMRGSEGNEVQIWLLPEALHDAKPRSPFRLQPQDLHALKLAKLDDFVTRVMKWLRSAYGGLPAGFDERRFVLELSVHARDGLGLKTERTVSDYIAASWLLRMPAERRLDMTPRRHEIPQATLARIHDTAFEVFEASSNVQMS